MVTEFSVASVHPDHVEYSAKDPETGAIVKHSIPTNFVLWSTGIAMNPFTARVSIIILSYLNLILRIHPLDSREILLGLTVLMDYIL